MGDAPRLTDRQVELAITASVNPTERALAIEVKERRAQSEGAQAKAVVEKLMKICTQDLLHEPDIAGDIMKVIDEHLSPPRQTEEAA